MRFYFYILFLFFVFPSISLISQNNDSLALNILNSRGEIYFSFDINDSKYGISKLSENISIEKIEKSIVYAYANKKEYQFIKNYIKKNELIINNDFENIPLMAKNLMEVKSWNFYPTYEQYDSLINYFANTYSLICDKKIIGQSVKFRNIYSLNLTNKNISEPKSKIHIASTIHGNELVGYIITLRLIDYLLINYELNENIKNLLDSNEIWITPLLNPDGTYFGGNNTIAYSKRNNFNDQDLNRNFPDPEDGEYPNGDRQVETQHLMNFVNSKTFTLSANIHTGIELVNYPWDTWKKKHIDDLWYQKISRQYADTAQKYSPYGYFDDLNNGITNGYSWYTINGGIQDYMNYFVHSRDITLELSNNHYVYPWDLEKFWNYNYRSLINYISLINTGIKGVVTDSLLNTPIKAKIEILNYDTDNSYIYSDKETGNYHRLINNGIYSLRITADGYMTKTIENFNYNNDKTILNIKLLKQKDYIDILNNQLEELQIVINPVRNNLKFYFKNSENENINIRIINSNGLLVKKSELPLSNNKIYEIEINSLNNGTYIINASNSRVNSSKHFVIIN